MARFLPLFRYKDQFQMVELAENLLLSNLWLCSAADSCYRRVILVLFLWGSKSTANETHYVQRVFLLSQTQIYYRQITRFEIWHENRPDSEAVPHNKNNTFASLSVSISKTLALLHSPLRMKERKEHIKQKWLQQDFSSVVDMYYLQMNNLFEKV